MGEQEDILEEREELLELKERVSNPFRNDMQVTSSILQDPTKMKSLTPTPPQQTNTHTHARANSTRITL